MLVVKLNSRTMKLRIPIALWGRYNDEIKWLFNYQKSQISVPWTRIYNNPKFLKSRLCKFNNQWIWEFSTHPTNPIKALGLPVLDCCVFLLWTWLQMVIFLPDTEPYQINLKSKALLYVNLYRKMIKCRVLRNANWQ